MDFTLGDYLNLINYKVNDGGDYLWKCFGPNAYQFEHDQPSKYNLDVIFDTVDRLVYMVVFGTMDETYQWINENYVEAYQESYKKMQETLGFADDEIIDFTGRTEEFKTFIHDTINQLDNNNG